MKRLALALCLGLLVAPASSYFGCAPSFPLEGVEPPITEPVFSVQTALEGTWQASFTSWFEAKYGLRGFWVKTDNSSRYYLFGETAETATFRVGRQKYLFADEDLWFFNTAPHEMPTRAVNVHAAERFQRAQVALARLGKVLVPLVVPSKTSVHRDKVAAAWVKPLGEPRPSDIEKYQRFIETMNQLGGYYVDGRRDLAAEKPDLVYPRTGRHWSRLAACRSLASVVALAHAQQPSMQFGEVDCTGYTLGEPPEEKPEERDLARLLNVWGNDFRDEPVPVYPPGRKEAPAGAPRILFAGSSYCWGLVIQAERAGAGRAVNVLFYDKTIVDRAAGTMRPNVPGSDDWKSFVFEHDVFVVDVFETFLPDHMGAFVEALEAEATRRAP